VRLMAVTSPNGEQDADAANVTFEWAWVSFLSVSLWRASVGLFEVSVDRLHEGGRATDVAAGLVGWRPAKVRNVKSRYPGDPLAPVRRRPALGGLAGGVDPVGFAAGVGEGSVGFDRVVFDRVDSEQFAVL